MSKMATRGLGTFPLVVTRGFGIEYVPNAEVITLNGVIQSVRELVGTIFTALSLTAVIQSVRPVSGVTEQTVELNCKIVSSKSLTSKVK